MLKDKLIDKDDDVIEEPRLVSPPSSSTFSRKETFTRMFTFDRSFTFDRTFTYDRRLSSTGGIFETEEAWTKKLISSYSKVAIQGNDGDIPIPLAFAQTKRFWQMTVFAGLIG